MSANALLIGCVAVLLPASTAVAQFVVGPGFDVANELFDTPASGGRINVDQTSPGLFNPGTYRATFFAFDAGQVGDVTPFLAVPASGTLEPEDPIDLYTAIAVGSRRNIAEPATNQRLPFGGFDTFTLTTPTLLYAGISSVGNNPIFFDNLVGTTDHEGTASNNVVGLGGTVPPDGAFSDPNLARTYSMLIEIELVPEPAAAAVLAFSALGILARPRRR